MKNNSKARIVCFANVRHQVSLAGGEGQSQRWGVKALGLLCSSQALCLNVESRQPPLESGDGQRLAAWPCSHYLCRGPIQRGILLPLVRQREIYPMALLLSSEYRPLCVCCGTCRSARGNHAIGPRQNRALAVGVQRLPGEIVFGRKASGFQNRVDLAKSSVARIEALGCRVP